MKGFRIDMSKYLDLLKAVGQGYFSVVQNFVPIQKLFLRFVLVCPVKKIKGFLLVCQRSQLSKPVLLFYD